MLKILALGDVVGDPGRKAAEFFINDMKRKGEADFVICNAENAYQGAGITPAVARELFQNGCDVLTSGDHVFDKRKEMEAYLAEEPRMLRPANYPEGVPGAGSCVVECKGTKIGVINVAGQVFMKYYFQSPFLSVDKEVERLNAKGAKIIIVDAHAETTSEKVALGWYLDGRVTAVFGTHTHIQTADEKVTEKGTAYITDLGMTGPYDSVIGREKESVIRKFLMQMGSIRGVPGGDTRLCGAIVQVDEITGRAVSMERLQKRLPTC